MPYITRVKDRFLDSSSELFVNPTWKELMYLSKKGKEALRFVSYYNEKEIYISEDNVLHSSIIEEIEYILKYYPDENNVLTGIINKVNNMFVAEKYSDMLLEYENPEIITGKDWSWLEKYKIDVNELIE